ncbi:MAG TPA: hypothetical protein VFR09_06870 [Alphaproteobacteria bacterium]|nr:hypothetical protein [Alphaproteobacteria bacterium]
MNTFFRESKHELFGRRSSENAVGEALGLTAFASVKHGDFPHAKSLRQVGGLSPEQREERGEGIYQAMLCMGFEGKLNRDNALFIANHPGATAGSAHQEITWRPSNSELHEHFRDGTQYKGNVTPSSDPIFVGTHSEPVTFDFLSTCTAAFVIEQPSSSPESAWAVDIGISPDKIKHAPATSEHRPSHIHDQLADTRVLRGLAHQLMCRHNPNGGPAIPVAIGAFYNEVDKYLYSRAAVRQEHAIPTLPNNPHSVEPHVRDILAADRHVSYVGMLTKTAENWVGPTVDALEAGKTPPDYYAIHRAVWEIRVRVMMELLGTYNHKHVPSPVLEGTIARIAGHQFDGPFSASSLDIVTQLGNEYTAFARGKMREAPGQMLTVLDRLKDEKVFPEGTLVGMVADEIGKSAGFFDRALLRDKSVKPAKKSEVPAAVPQIPAPQVQAEQVPQSATTTVTPETPVATQPAPPASSDSLTQPGTRIHLGGPLIVRL